MKLMLQKVSLVLYGLFLVISIVYGVYNEFPCACGVGNCTSACPGLRNYYVAPDICCPKGFVCALQQGTNLLTCAKINYTCGDYFSQWMFTQLNECCVPYTETNQTIFCSNKNFTHRCCANYGCVANEIPCPVSSSYIPSPSPSNNEMSSSHTPKIQTSSSQKEEDDQNSSDYEAHNESSSNEGSFKQGIESSSENEGFPTWAIAVIVVGGALILAALVGMIICCVKHRKNKEKKNKTYGNVELTDP